MHAVPPLRLYQYSDDISRYFDGFGNGAALRHQSFNVIAGRGYMPSGSFSTCKLIIPLTSYGPSLNLAAKISGDKSANKLQPHSV